MQTIKRVPKLVIWPDMRLSKVSEPVIEFDSKLNQLIIDMFLTLKMVGGVGLSACQIGINKAVFVYKTKTEEGVIINPTITSTCGENIRHADEGCISLPGVFLNQKRFLDIEIKYQNEDGKEQQKTFSGLVASIIQHEMDHLNGITIASDLSRLKQDILKRKINKLIKVSERQSNGREKLKSNRGSSPRRTMLSI